MNSPVNRQLCVVQKEVWTKAHVEASFLYFVWLLWKINTSRIEIVHFRCYDKRMNLKKCLWMFIRIQCWNWAQIERIQDNILLIATLNMFWLPFNQSTRMNIRNLNLKFIWFIQCENNIWKFRFRSFWNQQFLKWILQYLDRWSCGTILNWCVFPIFRSVQE